MTTQTTAVLLKILLWVKKKKTKLELVPVTHLRLTWGLSDTPGMTLFRMGLAGANITPNMSLGGKWSFFVIVAVFLNAGH